MSRTERAELNAILRNDFYAFLQRCFLTLNPGARFQQNWHLEALGYQLKQVRSGGTRRLMINLPPRHLKSLAVSVALPAFLLGHDPTQRVIVASYGSELAVKLANDFRTILTTPWYKAIFPGTRISRIKNTEYEVVTTRGGFRLATSVDGTLTGRGGDVIIIDDPLKPSDALSDSKRGHVNEWFRNTVLSRLDDKVNGAIIIVMQRLHDDDLCGSLLKGSDEWTHLKIPAIARVGEQIQIGDQRHHFRKVRDLLHPEREPIEVLDSMRVQIGPDNFAAQYLQEPVAPEGNMIRREWLRRYERPPARSPSVHVLQSWDTACKSGEDNDWSVCTTWFVIDGKFYLIDVLRGRFVYPTLKDLAIAHGRLHRPTTVLIEDSGVGTGLVVELQKGGLPAMAVKVEHNKETRMSIQSGKFASGQVFFPCQAPWLDELEAELFAFPGSRYDDQVDSISQALSYEFRRPFWDAKSNEGLNRLVTGLAMDQYFGWVTGRPW